MNLLKFCKYFYYIKTYFNKLPKDIQLDIVSDMEKYFIMARIFRHI